jgi:hypothetical protein
VSRTLTAALLAKAQAQQSDVVHLLALEFSGGTARFTTGAQDLTWNSQTWYAAHGGMTFAAVTETPDPSGQRLRITLDGVNLTAITALLAESYIGRLGTLYRAHLTPSGSVVADPLTLFVGYMNSAWDISEDPENGWCKVETELVSPLNVLDQVRGITADPNSHQAMYSGDTFFAHIATKPEGNFTGWGIAEKVPLKFGK